MVQILQEYRQPTTSERFGKAFSNLGQAASVEVPELLMQKQEDKRLGELIGQDISSIIDPNLRKMIVQNQLENQSLTNQFGSKQLANQIENEQSKMSGQKAFNDLASILKSGSVGVGSGWKAKLFGGEQAQDFGRFQSALGGLESMLVHLVNKGSMSDSRFKYITENLLPKPTDREDIIKGKLQGLADILGLDASSLGISKSISKEGKERRSLESFAR